MGERTASDVEDLKVEEPASECSRNYQFFLNAEEVALEEDSNLLLSSRVVIKLFLNAEELVGG